MTPTRREGARPRAAVRLAQLEHFELIVDQLVTGGLGLGRFEGIPIFVPRSLPGDRLRVRLVQRRPDYGRAEIEEILEPGPGRREAPCPYYGRCGGCDLQHVDDDLQPRLKAQAVRETLERLGGVTWPARWGLHVGSPWGYRLRCQLHSDETGLGYHARGSREVVAIDRCPILVPELEERLPGLAASLGDEAPKRLDMVCGDEGSWTTAPVVEGLPHGEIRITVGDFAYTFDARSFFQCNRELLPRLVDAVVGSDTGKVVYDLYCGVGLYSLPLSRRYERVVGVEGDRIAARHARTTGRRYGVGHLEVHAMALESFADRLPENVDRVVVNPPRGGLAGSVRRALLRARPGKLTYVSCDPATLARDLRVLGDRYRLAALDLFDLFPQTGHMETVVQLERASERSGAAEEPAAEPDQGVSGAS